MNGDLLDRAAWALSAEADAAPAPAPATRARILQQLATRRRRPGVRIGLAVSSVLLLSGSLALATAGVPAAARVWRIVIEKLSPAAPREVGSGARPRAERGAFGPRIQHLAAPPAPASPSPEAQPTPAAPAPAAGPSSPLAVFHRAHQLHFHRQNAGAALAAWEHYLQVDPEGPLVLEARYNRALCLVRLGRTAEASAALLPFADGTLAHYRQAEARALVQSLAGAIPPASP